MKDGVRVTTMVSKAEHEQLIDEAESRGTSLSSLLRQLVLAGARMPEPGLVDELRQARAEAGRRSRELGEARREIRELKSRLNGLLANGGDSASGRTPWSLDHSGWAPDEVERWWRWLDSGIHRLRERYGIVEIKFREGRRDEEPENWWEDDGRVRLLAALVTWDDMLDGGGDSVPADPRLVVGFFDYLRRLTSLHDGGLVRINHWSGSSDGVLEEEEAIAFEDHVRDRVRQSALSIQSA